METNRAKASWFNRTGIVLFCMMVGFTVGKLFFRSPSTNEAVVATPVYTQPGQRPPSPPAQKDWLIPVCGAIGAVGGYFVQRGVYR
jgi:hypothetical protein